MKNKLTLCLVAVIFMLLFAFLVLYQMNTMAVFPISVQISAGSETETVNLWESEEDIYYVFLPSYALAEQVKIHLNTDIPVYCDGQLLYEGMSCDMFSEGLEYNISFTKMGKKVTKPVIFLHSKNVATMYLDTQSGSMKYIHSKKGNKETASMRLYAPDGILTYKGLLDSIGGRGNSTWDQQEKKPYTIKLNAEVELLELGKAQKWILLANAYDHSHMRNKIVYDFAREVSDYSYWSPECEYIDLYLNGEYVGLYLLCEKIEDSVVEMLDNGDYLYELQWKNKIAESDCAFEVTNKRSITIQYPSNCREQEQNELSGMIIEFQDSLTEDKKKSDLNSKTWDQYIDIESWVKKYLIEEVFANFDAGQSSQYFWYNSSTDKIYAGPCWDYDLTLGQFWGTTWSTPYCMLARRDWDENNSWYNALYQKEDFKKALTRCYINEYRPQLQKLLESDIAVIAKKIETPAMLDHVRWETERDGKFWNDSVESLWQYLNERVEFLDNLWVDEAEYSIITFEASETYNVCVLKDSVCTALPPVDRISQGNVLGWYYSNSNEPFDPSKPITEDVEIYAKWEDIPNKKLEQVAKLVPLAVIAVIGLGLLWVELKRWKRSR